ncbi:MAG: DUF1501 domain-containing protein [Planctomycetaceae bacterium]
MIQAGSIGLLGLGVESCHQAREAVASESRTSNGDRTAGQDRSGTRAPAGRRDRSAIFIFLSGGLTQHDSFDPKPLAPVGIRGEFSPIGTRSPGMHVCEHLPLLAAERQVEVVRSLTTPYNEHSQGHMTILSGRTPMPPTFNAVMPMPGDWPSIAAVAGDVLPSRQQPAASDRAARATRASHGPGHPGSVRWTDGPESRPVVCGSIAVQREHIRCVSRL